MGEGEGAVEMIMGGKEQEEQRNEQKREGSNG